MSGKASSGAETPCGFEITYPSGNVAQIRIVSSPLGVLRDSLKIALLEAVELLIDNRQIRALIITGSGRSFSVGSDIEEFKQDTDWLLRSVDIEHSLFDTLEACRLPIIAACNGLTLGGGAELALACDLRVASRSAQFGFPEVTLGTFAGGGGTQRLPRHVGEGVAKHLLMTGRLISATEALRIGLVQELCADDELQEHTLAIAEGFARLSPEAVAATKVCLVTGLREGHAAGRMAERALVVEVGLGEAAAEGVMAFKQKGVST